MDVFEIYEKNVKPTLPKKEITEPEMFKVEEPKEIETEQEEIKKEDIDYEKIAEMVFQKINNNITQEETQAQKENSSNE